MQKKNTSYETATGIIDFPLTNDYMFRAVLQNNQMVLKGLTASLLHLDPDTISSIEITNPIVLGESIDNKDFILDILLILNNSLILNLEMQISNEHN
ncbi:MAG: PD-(D/E)XK nuclease family transposase [Agathobacter sp.]|nr:PD-(D/E)XK nuclease family transposase [Agathobacter sp.]